MTEEVPEVLHWADRHKRKKVHPAPVPVPVHIPATTEDRLARFVFEDEIGKLAAQTEGGRNDQLNASGFNLYQFVGAGRLPEHDVTEALFSTALAIGLDKGEIFKTLMSASQAGRAEPKHREADEDPFAGLIDPERGARRGVRADSQPPGFREHTDRRATPDPDGRPGSLQPIAADDEVERTSWWPLPIGERVDGAAEIPGPTHLVREDGQALLYSGKINGLLGESESGKSWVALYAVVQALAEGQRVLFLDFEDSDQSIFGRLRSMGAEVNLGTLDYADPTEGLGTAQSRDLRDALNGGVYALIVVDGVNSAMTLLGWDINSNTDATLFAHKLLSPLAATGACVLTVDHVPKNTENRGRGGIGAQAKRAMMTGCALSVEVQEPFGRGQSGVLKLTVDKDRPGHVRGASAGSSFAGRVHLDSDGERVRVRIETASTLDFDGLVHSLPTEIMEKVSRLLEDTSEPLSGRTIREEVPGKTTTITEAIEALTNAGYVVREQRQGRGGGVAYTSIRMYREGYPTEPVPSGSQVVPGTAFVSGSPLPLSYGGGNHYEPTSGAAPVEVVPGTSSIPDGMSSCNRCGEPVDDKTADQTAGYCVPCGRVMNP